MSEMPTGTGGSGDRHRDWKAEIRRRLADPAAADVDVLDEVAQHVEARYETLVARGWPEPRAYEAALAEVADRSAVDALLHPAAPPPAAPAPPEARRGAMYAGLGRDVRHACRTLVGQPGFTIAALVVLALGVGVNTAVFSLLNSVMLRPLPFADAGRLVRLWESNPSGGWTRFSVSQPNFLDWRAESVTFERMAAVTTTGFSLTDDSQADMVFGAAVTTDFLPVLGASPAIGRNFVAGEDAPAGGNGGSRVTIISHGLWQRHFNAAPDVLGRTLRLDGAPWTVVGVLPDGFRWDGSEASALDVLVPLRPDPAATRSDHRLRVIGRLRPDVTLDQARAELAGIAERLAAEYPASNRGWTAYLLSFREWLVPASTRQALVVFAGAAAFVLLIACGNIASLLMARGAGRQKELAIRAALGADRRRLVRQLLVEALLLALAAGGIGIAVAWAATRAFVAMAPATLPLLVEPGIDGRALAFALVSAGCTGLLAGVLPALQASRADTTSTLKASTAGSGGALPRQRLRHALVIGEVALSAALLVGAGLLMRSFWQLQHVDTGFDSRQVLTLRVSLTGEGYETDQAMRGFYDRLLEDVRALPGVRDATVSSIFPLTGGNTSTEIHTVGGTVGQRLAGADWRLVSAGYFRTMGIPLRGRDFADTDTDTSTPVVVISEAAARAYFPGEDPIGKPLIVSSFQDEPMLVVGVAGDVRQTALDAVPAPVVYASAHVYARWNPMFLAVRTAGEPTAVAPLVRARVRAIDPTVPVYDVRSSAAVVAEALGPRRFNMYLLAAVAGLALLLASVGLFGVMAYLVARRTRDIGVRLALGAAPSQVLRQVIGQGLTLAVAGLLPGIAGGMALAAAMRNLLFAVGPTDAVTVAGVSGLLLLVASLACYIPARRAMRIDPLVALRSE